MESPKKPQLELAQRILPEPLYHCLTHIFAQKISGCALVGGTALSGFYAGHRRSDDIDLFTKDDTSQRATVLAIKSLTTLGVQFPDEFQTHQYYRATCRFREHSFTIDSVIDANLFKVGQFESIENGILIATIETLLMIKAATLVSRCSEKDLYDLMWLFEHIPGLNFEKLIDLGRKIDRGVNGEAVLLSISGTQLSEEACDFALSPHIDKKEVHQNLIQFQKELIQNLVLFLKQQPALPLKELVKKIKRLK